MDEAQVRAIMAQHPETVALVAALGRDDFGHIMAAMKAINEMSDDGFALWRYLLRWELARRQATGVTS